MPEPTSSDLRTKFDIALEIADSRIDFCLDSALRDVKRKVGMTAYGEIFEGDASTLDDSDYLDEDTNATNETQLRLADVTSAVHYFAMAKLVINANIRMRPSGQVIQEQDAGSPGLTSSTQVVNKYLTPSEVQAWVDSLNAEGNKLIGPWMVEQEPVNPWGFSKVVRA